MKQSKAEKPQKLSISLESFIENFKDQIPDQIEHKILFHLYEASGFQRHYDSSIFSIPVSLTQSHKLALANLIHQAKNKLNLIECIEKYCSLLLTHPNAEARKIPSLFMDLDKEFQSESFSSNLKATKSIFLNTLSLLEKRNRIELSKLKKADYSSSCFKILDSKKLAIVRGTKVKFFDSFQNQIDEVIFTKDTNIKTPRLKKGSDYQVVVTREGKAYSVSNQELINDSETEVLIGGFHYAPGGNASDARQGGDNKPQINPFSLWDVAWRPAACDPRGMTLIDGEFWCDIYPMTEDGKNSYGKKIRTNIDWWETNEHIANQGKRCPSEEQFQKLAFGTTENQSSGARIEKASLAEKFTSKWGVMMSTGCYYVWGNPFTIPDPSKEENPL